MLLEGDLKAIDPGSSGIDCLVQVVGQTIAGDCRVCWLKGLRRQNGMGEVFVEKSCLQQALVRQVVLIKQIDVIHVFRFEVRIPLGDSVAGIATRGCALEGDQIAEVWPRESAPVDQADP